MAGGDGYSQNPVACDCGVHPHASKKVQLSFIFVIKDNTGVSHSPPVCCLFCVSVVKYLTRSNLEEEGLILV